MKPPLKPPQGALDPSQLRALAGVLDATTDDELDCEQYLARMAELVEARAAGVALPAGLAAAVAHERLCANCREETAALAAALAAEDALT